MTPTQKFFMVMIVLYIFYLMTELPNTENNTPIDIITGIVPIFIILTIIGSIMSMIFKGGSM